MRKRIEQAQAHYDAGELEPAFSGFLAAAEDGDVHAMCQVASMYSCGEGVRCDHGKALEWEIRSWEGGNLSAAVNVAITYRTMGDVVEAKKWFERAIESGDGDAALQLAKLYLVSDKETDKVRALLGSAIADDGNCQESIEEAKALLEAMAR